MDPFLPVVTALHTRAVRFVIIGVAGANYYALDSGTTFTTLDQLFLATHADALAQLFAGLPRESEGG